MKTKIYGGSDDLIEIEGAINDEINHYENKALSFESSDGTKGSIKYDGEWKIEVKSRGSLFLQKIPSAGDDGKHDGEFAGLPSYSDILILDDGIEWVKIGRKKLTP